ncbi:MAG: hypothetical protein HOQ16_04260, partial [Gemmatimonadaceae bacterium]|nr:hypothetical protein [Gemmatimonadaceae bacterium]
MSTTSTGDVGPRPRAGASLRTVRIALARGAAEARLQSDGDWSLQTGDGTQLAEPPRAGESWTVEPQGGRLALRREDGAVARPEVASIVARASDADGLLAFG